MMEIRDYMKKLVKKYGADAIMNMAEIAEKEVKKEESKWNSLISPYQYSAVGRQNAKKVEFPDWVDEIFNNVLTETNTSVASETKNLAITNVNFAKYIIKTCNDDGETLKNVISVLKSAPAWCKGYGLTRFRMELVSHILILHGNTKEVMDEMTALLNKYSPMALKVFANADNDFRHVLNHDIQMIAFAEKHVCKRIGETVKFQFAA